MIEIQSICSFCRTELTFAPAQLLLLMPTEPDEAQDARLVHGCASCGSTNVRTIEASLAMVLISKGVPHLPDLELAPAGSPHPENPPGGDPWSADDVIELHDLLATDSWFTDLLAAGDAKT